MLTTTWKRCVNPVNGNGRLTKFAENRNSKIENLQKEDEKNPISISEITLNLPN